MPSLKVFVAFALFVVAVAGVDAPFTNNTAVAWTPTASSMKTCGKSTFALAPRLTSANWRHCAALVSDFADSGVFSVTDVRGVDFIPVLVSGECTLAFRAVEPSPKKSLYTVGNADVAVILTEALTNFSHGTELGVRGTVECQAKGGHGGVQWQIFDSEG